jgi:hypothetical protein
VTTAATADELLPLTARVHRAGRALEEAPASPRVTTLRRLSRHATERMTEAALGYERQALTEELIAGVGDAAEALVFADRLREIGIDAEGYRGAPGPRAPLLAPAGDERREGDVFSEATLEVAARLRTVAEDLEQAWLEQEPARPAGERPEPVDQDALRGAVAEALRTLQELGGEQPPAEEAGERERAMVLLTLARVCLEHGVAALELIEADEPEQAVIRRLQPLARMPALQHAVAPEAEPMLLVELAGDVLAASPR